jgi:hypothetical protein
VQEALELILDTGSELALVGLGPEVLRRAGRAANGEWDQVIFLVVAERLVGEAVVRDALDLEPIRVARGRPDGVRPVRDADRLLDRPLCDVRIESAGGATEVGQAGAGDALRRDRRGGRRAGVRGYTEGNHSEGDHGCEASRLSRPIAHELPTALDMGASVELDVVGASSTVANPFLMVRSAIRSQN